MGAKISVEEEYSSIGVRRQDFQIFVYINIYIDKMGPMNCPWLLATMILLYINRQTVAGKRWNGKLKNLQFS